MKKITKAVKVTHIRRRKEKDTIKKLTYDLFKYLPTKLEPYSGKTASYVKSDQNFVEILSNIQIHRTFKYVLMWHLSLRIHD